MLLSLVMMEVVESEVTLVKLSDESTMQESDLGLHDTVLSKIQRTT